MHFSSSLFLCFIIVMYMCRSSTWRTGITSGSSKLLKETWDAPTVCHLSGRSHNFLKHLNAAPGADRYLHLLARLLTTARRSNTSFIPDQSRLKEDGESRRESEQMWAGLRKGNKLQRRRACDSANMWQPASERLQVGYRRMRNAYYRPGSSKKQTKK